MDDGPLTFASRISTEERARRKAAVDYARHSVALEGFTISATEEDLYRRYIEGEFTSAELSALVLDDTRW